VKGVGPETADSILLYGLDSPVFVIDEYTRRLVKGRRIASNLNYEYLRKLFETNLPKRFELYQDLHALIVEEGKDRKLVIRNLESGKNYAARLSLPRPSRRAGQSR